MKMPYLWSDKDRHGNVRYYVASPGHKKVRVRAAPGTPEFAALYAAALSGQATARKAVGARETRFGEAGTLRSVCNAYLQSANFKKLDRSTQRVRLLLIDRLCTMSFRGDTLNHGQKPFATMPVKAIKRIRDDHADRPEAANAFVKLLRQLYAFALDNDFATSNVARDVPYLESKNPGGFHAWTVEEVLQYEQHHPVGTMARLALALLLYTGQRRSDVVLFGREHVRNGWLHFTQVKGRNSRPVTLSIPIIDELQKVIDVTPSGARTFLVTDQGRPFASSNSFGNKFRDWCDAAGLPNCSAHGLRKAAGARLAEAGCSEKEIQAILGHSTAKEVSRYTKSARQKVLAAAAMERIVDAQPLIYCIRAGEFCKIGVSRNVASRLTTLQTASPVKLELLLTKPAGPLSEQALHARFDADRAEGEWFRFSARIRSWVDDQLAMSNTVQNLNSHRAAKTSHAEKKR